MNHLSLGLPLRVDRYGPLVVVTHGKPHTEIHPDVWRSLVRDKYLDMGSRVEVVPRSCVRLLWKRDMGEKPFPGFYAFRAYTRGRSVVLLSDWTETTQSLTWLLLHELTHVQVNSNPMLDRALRSVERPVDYLTSDEAHEEWPEEQLANLSADQLAPRYASRPGLNRVWWRSRVSNQIS